MTQLREADQELPIVESLKSEELGLSIVDFDTRFAVYRECLFRSAVKGHNERAKVDETAVAHEIASKVVYSKADYWLDFTARMSKRDVKVLVFSSVINNAKKARAKYIHCGKFLRQS